MPDIIAGCAPEDRSPQDKLTFLKVLLGYMGKAPYNLDSEAEWPILPQGISREDRGKPLNDPAACLRFAAEGVREWTNNEMIDKSCAALEAKLAEHPERYTEVRIVYPSPLISGHSNNKVNAAYARQLKQALSDRKFSLPCQIETQEANNGDLEQGIYILAKSVRGVPKMPTPSHDREKRFVYAVQRFGRQVMVGGNVKEDALYWVIDDGVTIGGTLCSYINHIREQGGTIGAVTTLSSAGRGAEILKPQQESADFLYASLDHYVQRQTGNNAETDMSHGLEIVQKTLCKQLANVGLTLDLNSPKDLLDKTTLTNQEILLLGAYFMAPDDQELRNKLSKALDKIGASIEGASYVVKTANLPAGDIKEFNELMNCALDGRDVMVTDYDRRPSSLRREFHR